MAQILVSLVYQKEVYFLLVILLIESAFLLHYINQDFCFALNSFDIERLFNILCYSSRERALP